MLEVRIARVIGEPTGNHLVERLVELGVDARAQFAEGTRQATARVYWGLSGMDCRQPALNKRASTYNKLDELERFDEEDIPHPRFWRRPPTAASLYPILGRALSHAEGHSIQLYNRPAEVEGAYNNFYTQVIPSANEWRVWVYHDRILGCYERSYQPTRWPPQRQGFGRNWWNGYGYELVDPPSAEAMSYAKAAVQAMKLDFAGVDLLQGENGRYYILEVNTCPGATCFCQHALGGLARKIQAWYNGLR